MTQVTQTMARKHIMFVFGFQRRRRYRTVRLFADLTFKMNITPIAVTMEMSGWMRMRMRTLLVLTARYIVLFQSTQEHFMKANITVTLARAMMHIGRFQRNGIGYLNLMDVNMPLPYGVKRTEWHRRVIIHVCFPFTRIHMRCWVKNIGILIMDFTSRRIGKAT